MNVLMVLTSHDQLGDTGNKIGFWREAFAASDRFIGAVCHAPAVFKHARSNDGKPLVAGRKVIGFTNTEEAGAGLTDVVPFLVEDMLKAKGADYRRGDDGASFVVTDGTLVTGQNPASSAEAARRLLALLKHS